MADGAEKQSLRFVFFRAKQRPAPQQKITVICANSVFD